MLNLYTRLSGVFGMEYLIKSTWCACVFMCYGCFIAATMNMNQNICRVDDACFIFMCLQFIEQNSLDLDWDEYVPVILYIYNCIAILISEAYAFLHSYTTHNRKEKI